MADMYMRNIRDWRDATLMLSFEEKGYFDEILNLIYIHDDHLPDKDDFICRSMPIHIKTHRRLKQKLIDAGVIEIRNGVYHNKRASSEIAKINEISEKNRVKAVRRWIKSLKLNEKTDAAAYAKNEIGICRDDADGMLKVKVKGKSESHKKTGKPNKEANNEERKKNAKFKQARINKCTIDAVLDPDGKIPEEYRRFAESQGLENPQRRFEDWACWWVGENGRKAGSRGWFQTWKARVRKDIDRQMAGTLHSAGQGRDRVCTTTEGARLALDRRRARGRAVR